MEDYGGKVISPNGTEQNGHLTDYQNLNFVTNESVMWTAFIERLLEGWL
jgi:hypothetical protein